MQRLAGLLFYSSFFISLCAAALSLATYVLLGLEISWRLIGFVFCGTWFIYNSHAIYSGRKLGNSAGSRRHQWVSKRRIWLLALAFLTLAGCVVLLPLVQVAFFLWLGHLVLLAVAYTVPLVWYKGRWRNLRSIALLKVLLIAYVWASVTVQLPLLNSGVPLADTYGYFLLYGRFLFILALAPLFDIRDVERDAAGGIITLPALNGQGKAKAVSVLLLIVFGWLVFGHYPLVLAAALALSAATAIFVVVSAKQGRHELFYSGLADGMMLLQALLVLGASWLL